MKDLLLGLRMHDIYTLNSSDKAKLNAIYRPAERYASPRNLNFYDQTQHARFNQHSNKLWDQMRARDGGGSLGASFTLLSDVMPNALSPFIRLAFLAEPQLFENIPFKSSLHDTLYRPDILDPNETPLARFCRLSLTQPHLIVDKLRVMNQSPESFFHELVNLKSGGLLHALEHLLHDKHHINKELLNYNQPPVMQRRLAVMMDAAGASPALIRKVTKLSHSVCDLMFRKYRLTAEFDHSAKPTQEGYQIFVQNKSKCMFTVLILSLYFICMRVMLNQKALFHPLSIKGIPSQISYVLATGCYLSVRELYHALEYKQWTHSEFTSNFPNFNDLIDLLSSILQERTKLVGCSNCHTPFFSFTDDFRVIAHKKFHFGNSCCPCCRCASEYTLL
ncbi:MAG: hypothetical protein MR571_02260 [Succinatimonas sp.]|nr:hypothetical protein [Succinatimonas sp.]